MTLWDLPRGRSARVSGLTATMNAEARQQLAVMGIQVGAEVVCLMRPPLGAPRVYQVAGAVVSVAHDVACGVAVARVADAAPQGHPVASDGESSAAKSAAAAGPWLAKPTTVTGGGR